MPQDRISKSVQTMTILYNLERISNTIYNMDSEESELCNEKSTSVQTDLEALSTNRFRIRRKNYFKSFRVRKELKTKDCCSLDPNIVFSNDYSRTKRTRTSSRSAIRTVKSVLARNESNLKIPTSYTHEQSLIKPPNRLKIDFAFKNSSHIRVSSKDKLTINKDSSHAFFGCLISKSAISSVNRAKLFKKTKNY